MSTTHVWSYGKSSMKLQQGILKPSGWMPHSLGRVASPRLSLQRPHPAAVRPGRPLTHLWPEEAIDSLEEESRSAPGWARLRRFGDRRRGDWGTRRVSWGSEQCRQCNV